MLEIKEVQFEELTKEQQDDQPNNGSGKEYANYIVVSHGGVVSSIYSDAMEPEDCSFSKDLNWVITAISGAYEYGVHNS